MELYETIVVGAGIVGSATAYCLASDGRKTLLLEQFFLPHTRGSSHGQSRITRKAYEEDFYTAMMEEATTMWQRLQDESGQEIFRQTGYLAMGPEGCKLLADNQKSLEKNRAPHQVLTRSQFKSMYTMLRFPDTFTGILDKDGGILRADKAIQAFQTQFKVRGGELKDGHTVTSVIPGDVITVQTNKGHFRCRTCVLTPGPWAAKLLQPMGINFRFQPMKLTVNYWREKVPGSHAADKLPPFYDEACCAPNCVYGLPSDEYKGMVKICLSEGPPTDPDARDQADSSAMQTRLCQYVKSHFPGLDPQPAITETCIRTDTPDRHPVIDRHPLWPNVFIGAGFSGHGFKLGPVVGKVLSELAQGKQLSYDLSPFRLDKPRFKAQL